MPDDTDFSPVHLRLRYFLAFICSPLLDAEALQREMHVYSRSRWWVLKPSKDRIGGILVTTSATMLRAEMVRQKWSLVMREKRHGGRI